MKRTPLSRATGLSRGKGLSRAKSTPRVPRQTDPELVSTWGVVEARAGGLCERCCKRPSAVQRHHRKPRQMGGTRDPLIHDPSNVVWICCPCHDWIESHRTDAYESGWLVHRGDDPASVSLRPLVGAAFWLDSAGRKRVAPPA